MELSWNAQQALIKRGNEPLLRALSHSDPSVRGKAAQALGWIKDPSVIPDLERLRTDRDPWVQRMVATAIDQLKDARDNGHD